MAGLWWISLRRRKFNYFSGIILQVCRFPKPLKKPTVQKTMPTAFTLAKIEEYYDEPARQAEYLYSLIQENPE